MAVVEPRKKDGSRTRTHVNRMHFPAPQRFSVPTRTSLEENMERQIVHKRSIGLLVAFATFLTLIAIWNGPDTESECGI